MSRNQERWNRKKPTTSRLNIEHRRPEPEVVDRMYRSALFRAGQMSQTNYDNRLNRKYGGKAKLDQLILDQRLGAWQPNVDLPALPTGLNVPGIDPNTGKTVGRSGVFFPAYNRIDGKDLIVGGQIWSSTMIDGKREKSVVWASSARVSGVGPQIHSELPLFQNIIGEPSNTIDLCEGGEKSLILSQRLASLSTAPRVFVLGAAGGQFPANGLRSALELLKCEEPGRPTILRLWPDAGSYNNKGVRQSYFRAIGDALEHARANGYELEVQVAWWGQYSKDRNEIRVPRSGTTDIAGRPGTADEVSDCDEISSLDIVRFDSLESSMFYGHYRKFMEEWQPEPCPASKKDPYRRLTGIQVEEVAPGTSLEELILKSDRKYILDLRPTGSGKTHSVEDIEGAALYFTKDPYNSPTEYIAKNFIKLPARHEGRYLHPELKDGAGNPKSEGRPNGGEFVEGNCIRNEGRNNLYSSGIEESICIGCASKMTCTSTEGWLLHDYSRAITADKIKLHPQSMPVEATKFADRVGIFDDCALLEPAQNTITARALRVRAEHVINGDIYPPAFKDFFQQMVAMSDRAISAESHYGISEAEVAQLRTAYDQLPTESKALFMEFERRSSDIDYEGKDVLLPNNASLKASGKQSLFLADHKVVQRAAEDNRIEAINSSYANGAIGKIGDVLFNHPDATFKFSSTGDLIISYCKPSIKRAMLAVRQVRVLDATLNVDAFCSLYLIDPNQVLVIKQAEQKDAHSNLTIASIRGLGALTKQSTDRQKMVAAHIAIARAQILGPGQVAFIASAEVLTNYSKLFSIYGVLTGKPHSDSRGSNSFIGCSEIYIASSLRKNLGAIITEFGICYRQLVEPKNRNPQFAAFKNQQQAAEVVQAIGRLRHGRRPDEYLKIFFMGDIDGAVLEDAADSYPGANKEIIDVCDMDGYMPLPVEESRFNLYDAMAAAGDAGQKMTIRLLAQGDGALHEASIARILRQQGNCTPTESRERVMAVHRDGADFLPSQKLAAVDPLYYEGRYGPPIGIPTGEIPVDHEQDAREIALAQAAFKANESATERVLVDLLCAGVEPPDESPWSMNRSTSDPPVQ
jgi:hypothetical protein